MVNVNEGVNEGVEMLWNLILSLYIGKKSIQVSWAAKSA